MNLRETVSVILHREVSEQEAMEFANNQFGVLATHIRDKSLLSFLPKQSLPEIEPPKHNWITVLILIGMLILAILSIKYN